MSEAEGTPNFDEPEGFFKIEGDKVSRIEPPKPNADATSSIQESSSVMENPYIAPLANMDYINASRMEKVNPQKPASEQSITIGEWRELQKRAAAEAAAKAPHNEQTLVSQSTQRIETPAQPATPASNETGFWAGIRKRFGGGKS